MLYHPTRNVMSLFVGYFVGTLSIAMGWTGPDLFQRQKQNSGSIFRQKSVVPLLEKNYKALQALQLAEQCPSEDIEMVMDVSALGETFGDLSMDADDEKDDDEMEVDVKRSGFKEKVIAVLKEGKYDEKRSSKLAQADFMHLLALFNKAGIHFSWSNMSL